MSSPQQDWHDAIRKKKARIQEIELILSEPRPVGGLPQARIRLIEEKLRWEEFISELERVHHPAGAPKPQPAHGGRDTSPKGCDKLGKKKQDLSQYLDGARLTDRQRDCCSLRLEYGLRWSEIERRLGIDHSTAQEHFRAGKRKIDQAGNRNTSQKRKARFSND